MIYYGQTPLEAEMSDSQLQNQIISPEGTSEQAVSMESEERGGVLG